MAGMYVYLWLIHTVIWQKPTQHCNYSPIKNRLKIIEPNNEDFEQEFEMSFVKCLIKNSIKWNY